MTSKKTSTTARPTCGYPGCDQPAAQPGGPGRPPEYCAGRGHARASAWKERRRLNAEKSGTTISAADDASPVTMAKVGGAELLRSLRAEADRIAALGKDQDRATAAEERAQAAEAERDAAVAKAEADAEERIAAASAERDEAIAQARAEADAKVRAAEAERDEARSKAAGAEVAAVEVRQDIARAETAAPR